MKKIYTLLLLVCVSAFSFAQTKSFQSSTLLHRSNHVPQVKAAALGDTLFLFDGNSFYITNPDDQTNFDFLNQDVDELIPAQSANGWESDWNFFARKPVKKKIKWIH